MTNNSRRVYKPSSNKLGVRRRHFAFTALDRIKAKLFGSISHQLVLLYVKLRFAAHQHPNSILLSKIKRRILILLISSLFEFDQLVTIEQAKLWQKLPKIQRKHVKIDDFSDNFILTNFRFKNKDQLHSLIHYFRFPERIKSSIGEQFTADEVLLSGLYRLHYPNRFVDVGWINIFGFDEQKASACCLLFYFFMINNWSYLLFDHLEYWYHYFPYCNNAIHSKLTELGCNLPFASEQNGFRIFGFIDNTIISTARPGGGPSSEGVNARRKDPLIQRAFYNGWKKQHGIKFQTLDLPNGLNAHIVGPFSCRKNDLFLLRDSQINQKLSDLQTNNLIQYKVYGDSAYMVLNDTHIRARYPTEGITPQQTIENKVLSKCRESIEWNYGQLKEMWSFIDFKKNLKLLKSPIGVVCVCAMILRNAYVTMNGNITSTYFNYQPPTLEDWTSRGPRNANIQLEYE